MEPQMGLCSHPPEASQEAPVLCTLIPHQNIWAFIYVFIDKEVALKNSFGKKQKNKKNDTAVNSETKQNTTVSSNNI